MPDCPICTRPSEPALAPFCSRRCADIDLGRWFTGGYTVPSDEDDEPGLAPGVDPGGDVG